MAKWSWLYSDVWYGLCPSCGNQELVEDTEDDESLDLATAERERDHVCGPDLPSPFRYEEHYGISDLKRKMGFPEELI